MPIRAVSGKPGAGKSLFLVSRVCWPAVVGDRPLYVWGLDGLTLQHEQMTKDFLQPTKSGHYIPKLSELEKIPPGAVIVFDEAHMVFGAGSGKELGADLRNWFATHRHRTDHQGRSQEIWVACQDPMQLTSQFRALVAEFYHFKRATLVGVKGWSFMNVWDGPPGQAGAVRTGTRLVRDDRRCYKFYKSAEGGVSSSTDSMMFTGGKLKAFGGTAFLLAIAYAFYSLSYGLDPGGGENGGAAGETPEGVSSVAGAAPKNPYDSILLSPRDYTWSEGASYMTITIDPGVIPEHGRYPWYK